MSRQPAAGPPGRRAGRLAGMALATAALAGGCGGEAAPEPVSVTVDAGGLADAVATGVPVGPGRVLTVAHVVSGARSVRVGGRTARVVRVDPRLDLAELAVGGIEAPRVRYARGGEVVRVHLLRGTVSARVLRRATTTLDGFSRPALEVDTAVHPGDSGAPVTDTAGRLVGIVFARTANADRAWVVRLTN